MIPSHHLEADLGDSFAVLASTPLAELLLQHGILRRLAADHLRRRLRDSVVFGPEEEPLVIARLVQGTSVIPPTSLAPGWLEQLPPLVQGPVRDRWDQIRLQKWMEEAYRDQLEPYFLERRDELEQVVYGMIRLRNQGAAEELYLRLLDDQADFGDLARSHSLGEERFTRGLVGPMLISQPHPTIRSVLQNLAVGDLHPPFRVDNWILLVQMEHRQPARLNDATLLQLSQELLQRDLEAVLDAQLEALYPGLLEAFPPRPQPVAEPGPAVAGSGPVSSDAPLPPQPAAVEPTAASTPAPLPQVSETVAAAGAQPPPSASAAEAPAEPVQPADVIPAAEAVLPAPQVPPPSPGPMVPPCGAPPAAGVDHPVVALPQPVIAGPDVQAERSGPATPGTPAATSPGSPSAAALVSEPGASAASRQAPGAPTAAPGEPDAPAGT